MTEENHGRSFVIRQIKWRGRIALISIFVLVVGATLALRLRADEPFADGQKTFERTRERLVNGLRIAIRPQHRLVAVEPGDGRCERDSHDVAGV